MAIKCLRTLGTAKRLWINFVVIGSKKQTNRNYYVLFNQVQNWTNMIPIYPLPKFNNYQLKSYFIFSILPTPPSHPIFKEIPNIISFYL